MKSRKNAREFEINTKTYYCFVFSAASEPVEELGIRRMSRNIGMNGECKFRPVWCLFADVFFILWFLRFYFLFIFFTFIVLVSFLNTSLFLFAFSLFLYSHAFFLQVALRFAQAFSSFFCLFFLYLYVCIVF